MTIKRTNDLPNVLDRFSSLDKCLGVIALVLRGAHRLFSKSSSPAKTFVRPKFLELTIARCQQFINTFVIRISKLAHFVDGIVVDCREYDYTTASKTALEEHFKAEHGDSDDSYRRTICNKACNVGEFGHSGAWKQLEEHI